MFEGMVRGVRKIRYREGIVSLVCLLCCMCVNVESCSNLPGGRGWSVVSVLLCLSLPLLPVSVFYEPTTVFSSTFRFLECLPGSRCSAIFGQLSEICFLDCVHRREKSTDYLLDDKIKSGCHAVCWI